MRRKIKQLPEAVKKQLLFRFATGLMFIVLFLSVLIYFGDFGLYLPCLLFAVFLLSNAGLLLYHCMNNQWVSVRGICETVEVTGIKKRIKSITLKLDEGTLKILVKSRLMRLTVGDTVTVYLSSQTPVYDDTGGYLICSYYALEIRKTHHQ